MKQFLSIPLFVLLIACGGNKKEVPAAVNKDSLIVPEVHQVAGIGRIEPEDGLINLSSDQQGLIKKILIKEGDTVKQGQQLVLLDNALPSAQRSEASSRVQTETAQLAVIRTNIEEAENNLRKAEQDLEKTRTLVARNAETKQTLEDAITDVNNKQTALQTQKANLTVSQQRINEIRQQVNTANKTISRFSINAPSNGLILEVSAKPGEAIGVGQSFAQLAPEGKITALCEIDELFADKVKPGQTAFIRYKGYADTVSTGTVIYTAPYLKKKSLFSDQVGEKEDRRVREVRIELNNQNMLINRQVECVIILK